MFLHLNIVKEIFFLNIAHIFKYYWPLDRIQCIFKKTS